MQHEGLVSQEVKGTPWEAVKLKCEECLFIDNFESLDCFFLFYYFLGKIYQGTTWQLYFNREVNHMFNCFALGVLQGV